MSARLPNLSRVIPSTTTDEVEHRLRVGRAFGVPLDDRMPSAAVRAHHKGIELTQDPVVVHPVSIACKRDIGGQRRNHQVGLGDVGAALPVHWPMAEFAPRIRPCHRMGAGWTLLLVR